MNSPLYIKVFEFLNNNSLCKKIHLDLYFFTGKFNQIFKQKIKEKTNTSLIQTLRKQKKKNHFLICLMK